MAGSADIVERGRATQFRCGEPAAREAQKKSAKKRKENRSMRETMKLLAKTTIGAGSAFDIGKLKSLNDVSNGGKNLTAQDIIALKIVQGAIEDDPECRRLFLELTGAMEKAAENQEEDEVRVIIDV